MSSSKYKRVSPTNARGYPRQDSTRAAVLRCLRDGAVGPTEIGDYLCIGKHYAAVILDLLKHRGLVRRAAYGYWELVSRETAVRVYGETEEAT